MPRPTLRLRGVASLCAMVACACGETSAPSREPFCTTVNCDGLDASVSAFDGGTYVTLPDGGSIYVPGLPTPDAGSGVDGAVPASDGATPGEGLPCDVYRILETNCKTCHALDQSAGFPLATLSDLHAPAKSDPQKPVYASVVERLNSTDTKKVMPPAGTTQRPSADEIARITNWAVMGAPTGAACGALDGGAAADGGSLADGGAADGGAPVDGGRPDAGLDAGATDGGAPDAGAADAGGATGLTCYRLLAHADGDLTKKFPVGVANDAYFNMTFAAPWTGNVYAEVVRPVTDNGRAIHHWLLFKDGSAGQAGRVVASNGTHPAGALLFGWAPGGTELDLRAAGDTGLLLPGNTTYTVEYHYNSSDASALDASGVELCVSTTPPTNISTQSWLGKDRLPGLNAPATSWTGTCKPRGTQRIHIVAVNPHMHVQGRHMRSVINRANGTTYVLQDSDFNFDYQQTYRKDVWLEAGETITTTCTYAAPALFGTKTTDEMCYLFTMAYPAGALADGNSYGQAAHGENTCIGNP